MENANAQAVSATFEPDIVVLYCQQSAIEPAELAGASRKMEGFTVRFVNLPCSSNVEIGSLVKIFEQGVDGIQVVGCPIGTCRFLGGNTRAERRVRHVKDILGRMDFGAERLGMVRAGQLSTEDLIEFARMRAEAVTEIGPNPMRG